MGREAWVLQQWLAMCINLGIDNAFAEEWGGKIMDGYRYFFCVFFVYFESDHLLSQLSSRCLGRAFLSCGSVHDETSVCYY